MAQSQLVRPGPADVGRLGVAVVFIALSGPMIAATAAAPLAIAFWRCLLGSGLTGVWVVLRERAQWNRLTAREWRLTAWAGVLLGLHFATWIPSLWLTSVASSTALVATQPVWAAVIARAMGVHIPRTVWWGIGIALVGVLILTGVDFATDPRSLIGDALALIGAVFAAAYVSVGERVRATVATATMTFILYAVAALTVVPLLIVTQSPIWGFSLQAWLLILGVTLGAQLLGHTLMNAVLARTSATVVSLAILWEMPGATIIAAIWLGQIPPLAVIPAAALILIGLVLVIRSSARAGTELARDLRETPPI